MPASTRLMSTLLLVLLWTDVAAAAASTTASGNSDPAPSRDESIEESLLLPPSVPDPLEPFNRVMWAVNREIMRDVVKPTSKVYRFIVRKPVRTGIRNFGRNITYPTRLINTLLQGRWKGTRDETRRFLCNTFVGGAGFVDVASRWNIPKADADFGQTFGRWGWRPQLYLMLPVFGPSNDRDTLGLAVDTAANPLSYVTPYSITTDNPLTFISPYMYFSYAVTYNNLSDTVEGYVRFTRTEADPYSVLQYAWTFVRKTETPDFGLKGGQDPSSLETLHSAQVNFRDPKFPGRGKTRSVAIPTTSRKLKFTRWLQPGKAPIVYLVPGLGSHRLAATSLALAELVYQNGFSVVCVSSPYNHEFMENASTAAMPAYTPVDVRDLQTALKEIDRCLNASHPGRLGATALMGYSMGGFQTLFAAGTAPTNQIPVLKFDRYVAIDPPVRLTYGISKLDEFYRAPLEWPRTERTGNIENLFLKVASSGQGTLQPQTRLPFSAIESKFLIGLTFRFILRDIIFSSQRRHNQQILRQPLDHLKRGPVYEEILDYSYADYFRKFAVPYYQTRGIDLSEPAVLDQAGDLRTLAEALRISPHVRVIVNENDFLLPPGDLAWLRATFPPEQLKVFNQGGHLGNLAEPAVRAAILKALDGLH